MENKIYVDQSGNYLGEYSVGNTAIPAGAIEVSLRPDDAGKIYDFDSDSWGYSLQDAKDKKITEIKALRKSNLLKSTPQTITYSGNLENKTFNISEGDLDKFTTIINELQDYNVEVDNEATRFLLTSNDIMIDWIVKQRDLNLYFKVVDLSHLDNELGYEAPTRTWGDATGERLLLDISDFKSLRKHLNLRDAQEYDQARLKIEAFELLETIEEIEAFDITQIIV